jgi:D-tyrosyl-tRNA(Tyr) deacylase
VHGLRILEDERSVADDPSAAVLAVSQFTLYGDARKGRRPTWAAVELVNVGPMTLLLEA